MALLPTVDEFFGNKRAAPNKGPQRKGPVSAETFLGAPARSRRAQSADAFLDNPAIPTVDEFFGTAPQPPAIPSADDFFAAPAPVAAPKPVAPKPAAPAAKLPTVDQFFDAVAPTLKTGVKAWKRRAHEAGDLIKEGNTQFATQSGESAYWPVNMAAGAGKMVGGAFSGLASPITGMIEGVVGQPVETATGGRLKKETTADIAETVGGFVVGGPKAKAPRVAAPLKAVEEVAAVAPKVVKGVKPTVDEFFGTAPTMAAKTDDPIDDILFAPTKRRTGTLKLPEPKPAVRAGLKEVALDAAGAVQKVLAPATIGQGNDAARTIRRASAEGDLLAAQSAKTLVKHARRVAELPVPAQRNLIAYIEGRSLGANLADPSLQKSADDIRRVNESYRQRVGQVLGLDEAPAFIRDYYVHMWKEAPGVVENRMLTGRQGSGRNLKQRTIPTLQDGIDAGLTPLTENPIEATLNYATNMSRYLSTVDAQTELTAEGLARWAAQGHQPEGWVPLAGIRTEKPAMTFYDQGRPVRASQAQRLFAPADVARVYNNWVQPGMEATALRGVFEPARRASNGMVQLKLGLSAFHAVTMAQEAMISELARGVQAGSRVPGLLAKGNLADAGDQAFTALRAAAKSPGAFIGRAIRGDRMRKELLGLEPPTGLSQAVNDAYVRSGGRVRMDPLYRTRGAGSFYNTIKDGTWKRELQDTAGRIFGRDSLMSERAKGVIDLGANVIQTTAAPLFEYYIPRVKQGAFASTMEDWLRINPGATQRQIDEAAFHINRSIDNRFGEMAWDNLFWHRYLKQASQILLLSPTWNLGTINEIGGGLLDAVGPSAKGLVSGQGVTARTAYVAAGAAQVALMNGILTYLKTGSPPEGMDFAVYRTGGTDATSGAPERAITPGYQKDVFAFGHDFPNHIGQEIKNKLNPALKTALELGSNKDYRGLPIRPGDGARPSETDRGLDDYLIDAFLPISLAQLRKGDKVGSNLTDAEKFLAVRPAPAYLQSPERVDRLKKLRNRKEWERKRRADSRDQARREQR